MIRRVTLNCINLTKYSESYYAKPYLCPAKIWTIGWGHRILPNEKYDQITPEQGETILYFDLIKSQKAVLRLINVPLEDYQYDALVDFCFNLGGGALQRSTLRMKINREEHNLVPNELRKWVYARGIKLKGLVRRREAEAILYETGELII